MCSEQKIFTVPNFFYLSFFPTQNFFHPKFFQTQFFGPLFSDPTFFQTQIFLSLSKLNTFDLSLIILPFYLSLFALRLKLYSSVLKEPLLPNIAGKKLSKDWARDLILGATLWNIMEEKIKVIFRQCISLFCEIQTHTERHTHRDTQRQTHRYTQIYTVTHRGIHRHEHTNRYTHTLTMTHRNSHTLLCNSILVAHSSVVSNLLHSFSRSAQHSPHIVESLFRFAASREPLAQ